ncbi:MAG: hypothetical protein WA040_24465 [Anaerolineae bacterium]
MEAQLSPEVLSQVTGIGKSALGAMRLWLVDRLFASRYDGGKVDKAG